LSCSPVFLSIVAPSPDQDDSANPLGGKSGCWRDDNSLMETVFGPRKKLAHGEAHATVGASKNLFVMVGGCKRKLIGVNWL